MISHIPSDKALTTLLRNVTLATNKSAIKEAFVEFQKQPFSLDQIQMTQPLAQIYLQAKIRIKPENDVPSDLQDLMRRLKTLVDSFLLNPVLAASLKVVAGDEHLEKSLIDQYLGLTNLLSITASDIYFLMGSDWGSAQSRGAVGGFTLDAVETLGSFYTLIAKSVELDIGTQAAIWRKNDLHSHLLFCAQMLESGKELSNPGPTKKMLKSLMKSDAEVYYLPIGYSNQEIFYYHLIAIDYKNDAFRFRLLSPPECDALQAIGLKPGHYCPEIIWEGLDIQTLLNSDMWKALGEYSSLSSEEVVNITYPESGSILACSLNHLVPWLIGKLGKNPLSKHIEIHEWEWEETQKNRFFSGRVRHVETFKDVPTNDEEKSLLLRSSGKEMKRSHTILTLFKFANLIPLDRLPTHPDRLLFKAESRLMLLTAGYNALCSDNSPPNHRSRFIRLLEDCWGKVTGPVERLMKLNPTPEQREAAICLLVSVVDLKNRIAELVHTSDRLTLAVPNPMYASTYEVEQLPMNLVRFSMKRPGMFDLIPIDIGTPPLEYHEVWTQDVFASTHRALETWYELLLDAKSKCEGVEVLLLAHKNVFSRLPIPKTDQYSDLFPEPVSEGLVVGTVSLLKKISSLVSSEVFAGSMIPPLQIADMTRVYRFCSELLHFFYRFSKHLPVSWFCLHEYMNRRNSFHIPGEVKKTLEMLVKSFEIMSPKGHLKPSEDFKEIPLFYYSWNELPTYYVFHRERLGSMSFYPRRSVEEVLSVARLADSVGLKPEETCSTRDADKIRWENSFAGQITKSVEEIAQYYTISILSSVQAFRKVAEKSTYLKYCIHDCLGPEDFFLLETISQQKNCGEAHHNRFGDHQNKYTKDIDNPNPKLSQRMVKFHDNEIKAPFKNPGAKYFSEFTSQAEILKNLKKQALFKNDYQLHQAVSGPVSLSIDVLLELFEAHPAYLFNIDYRSYFLAIIHSGHVLEEAIQAEPLLMNRLLHFIERLRLEDEPRLVESNLNLERMLWACGLARHLCRLEHHAKEKCVAVLEKIVTGLHQKTCLQPIEEKAAPQILASQAFFLPKNRLPLVEQARLHLIVGATPPTDSNEMTLWLEVVEYMRENAPRIIHEFVEGDLSTRRQLWQLLLSSEKDIDKIIKKKPPRNVLKPLAKTTCAAEMRILHNKYLFDWEQYFKKNALREYPWREEANMKACAEGHKEIVQIYKRLCDQTNTYIPDQQYFGVTPTSLFVFVRKKRMSVDWASGRVFGREDSQSNRLPVYLRKLADFACLGPILTLPIYPNPNGTGHCFKGISNLIVDMNLTSARLNIDGRDYRLLSEVDKVVLDLPSHFNSKFSLWFTEEQQNRRGVVAVHGKDGVPFVIYSIDSQGQIHPITGNKNLTLGRADYYPEVNLFNRWGLVQSQILVWLDDDKNIVEMHLPLSNGEKSFTRVIRKENGDWWVDGLELTLEPVHRAVAAFAGFPVYLIARNANGQKFLLLPGATPFEMEYRKERHQNLTDWNKVYIEGPEEKIHQYRLLPTGQIEGLTVANNLLLMLWKLHMGHYAEAASLAKHWIAPPGRAYTEEEQDILMSWIPRAFGDDSMKKESNPSSLSVQIFVFTRVFRHLKTYPPKSPKGKGYSKLYEMMVTDQGLARSHVEKHLSEERSFEKQIRETKFDQMVNVYDHEDLMRYLRWTDHSGSNDLAGVRMLYRRQTSDTTIHLKGANVGLKILNREMIDEEIYRKYSYAQLIEQFPVAAQTGIVPIETIKKSIVPVRLMPFFDKAYNLIKDGPQDAAQKIEYDAVIEALRLLRGDRMNNVTISYYSRDYMFLSESIHASNLILWIILEKAYKNRLEGKPLPSLPSINRKFGLALTGSEELTQEFFNQIVGDVGILTLWSDYAKEWFKQRGFRVLHQETKYKNMYGLRDKLKQKVSPVLINTIDEWKVLKKGHSVEPNDKVPGPMFVQWNYPTPSEWATMPLDQLQANLSERLNKLSAIKLRRENELLLCANKLVDDKNEQVREFALQLHYGTPFTIDECVGMALGGMEKLHLPVLFYLEIALEVAHLERSAKELQECLKSPNDLTELDKFRANLMTPHHYLPSVESLPLMISEYYTDCRLRSVPNQAKLIDQMTSETPEMKGTVVQAIMGSGKTKKIGPMWLQMMLMKGYRPFLCVPSSILKIVISDMQEMMWTRYKTHVRGFTFSRDSCTKESLLGLTEVFKVAEYEPTVFVTTPRDLGAYKMMLRERHQIIEDMRSRLIKYTCVWAEQYLEPEKRKHFQWYLNNDSWNYAQQMIHPKAWAEFRKWHVSWNKLSEELRPLEEQADMLQALRNQSQQKDAILFDEVAEEWDPRNLLSYPIGWQIPANPSGVAAGIKIYFDWLAPYYDELDLMTNMQSMGDRKATRQKIYLEIAKSAWNEYSEVLVDLPNLEIFTAYVLGDTTKGKPTEKYILALNQSPRMILKQQAQEIAYLKYALTTGLENTLTTSADVNYGRAKEDPLLYLIVPYLHNGIPKKNTLFRKPWKTILATCQYYSQFWKDPNQTMELIGFLQGIDPSSKDTRLLEAAHTIWRRRFGDANLVDKQEMQQMTEQLDQARLDKAKAPAARLLIGTYLQSCVFPTQLKLDPSQFTSSPQDLAQMGAKTDAMGGVWGFEPTWCTKLIRCPDNSSDETVMKALREERNQICHVYPKGGIESLFKFLTQGGFLSKYTALVDIGAVLRGPSNETIARRFFGILQAYGFDSVLFPDQKDNGDANYALITANGKETLEVSDRAGISRTLIQLKLNKTFIFLDHARRFGSDLAISPGRVLRTFSDSALLDDVKQGVMRARGLVTGVHSIETLIPGEMGGEWSGDRVSEVADMQQKIAQENNYFSGECNQLNGLYRQIVDVAMQEIPYFQSRHQIHQAASGFLMEHQSNDLVELFGTLSEVVESEKVVQELISTILREAEKNFPFKVEKIKKELEEILEWHKKRGTPFPKYVRKGDSMEDAVQEVDISKMQESMRQKEEEYERMLGTRNPKIEVAWTVLDVKTLTADPLGTPADGDTRPTLYLLRDALKERGYHIPVADNILISANLMTTYIGEVNVLLTPNQKPVHRVLYMTDPLGDKVILVSEGDAYQLKQHLLKMKGLEGKGIYLIEPSGQINQRGSRQEKISNLWDQGSLERRSLLMQVLCLQGSAIFLEKKMETQAAEVRNALDHWTKMDYDRVQSIRIFFETALELKPDEMLQYKRSKILRQLFNHYKINHSQKRKDQ